MSPGQTICLCYCVLSIGTYAIWPSRWNILAHMNLAFSAVAYVIPILFLGWEQRFSITLLESFARIMAIGTTAYVFGMLLGALLAGRRATDKLRLRVERLDRFVETRSARRLIVAIMIGVTLTLIAAVVMGGLPLFSDDPLTAKYFRGESKARYDQVSILYRLGTGILTVVPPISLALALEDRKRRGLWLWLSGVSLFLMLATLQRGPMAEGLLIIISVVLIWKGRYLLTAITICGTYIVGALFYTVLAMFGINTGGVGSSSPDFFTQVASTAPDVTDTLSFLLAWINQGEPLTLGRTMWGGLVPGRYEWNPAVWSLVTQNFGTDIDQIRSGGLRLPVPVWGIVNFGEYGLILIPLIAGLIAGFATRKVANVVPAHTIAGTTILLVGLNTILLTVGSFYMIGYLEVVKAAALLWVLLPCLRVAKEIAEKQAEHPQFGPLRTARMNL